MKVRSISILWTIVVLLIFASMALAQSEDEPVGKPVSVATETTARSSTATNDVPAPVPGRKYLTLGRDPMVPGGITGEKLKPGQEIVTLVYDVYVKDMRGAHGELVSGWLRAGTQVVARKVKSTDAQGREIWAWKVEAAQPCGNTHPVYYAPAPAPPVSARVETRVEYRDREVIREVEVERPVYLFAPRREAEVPETHTIVYYEKDWWEKLIPIAAAYAGAPRVSVTANGGKSVAEADASAASSSSSSATATQQQQTGVVISGGGPPAN